MFKEKRLTNAAALLFGKNPQEIFLQTVIKAVRFKGTDVTEDMLDFKIIEGNIFNQFEKAEDFIFEHIPKQACIEENKLQRQEKWLYPPRAIREALSNALAHRDYKTASSIQIRIFDHRMEIWNPGCLPTGLTIEKLKTKHDSIPDNQLMRNFYEVETIKNNWTVRELQRAMNSMLFERTGLSTNKQAVLSKNVSNKKIEAKDIFRNPLMLEFLGLEEKPEYSENDLEQAIISHLQTFLIEIGRGFCFEARQKRITFDNKHYRIDLIFYHRILKCHVLIDLKIGEFIHADSGQMNVYLNYYKENEMNKGDSPPIGIKLCASNNENLVKYATFGLPQKVFVSKYLVNLPNEEELKKIIHEEQKKF